MFSLVDRKLRIGFGLTLVLLLVFIFALYGIFSTPKSVTIKDAPKGSGKDIKVETVKLSSDISDASSGRNKHFVLKLKNDTKKYAKLSFLNAKEFSYKVTTADGKVVFKEGAGKKLDSPKAKRVNPESSYDITIDITKQYNKLKEGSYLIQAETTAKEADGLIVGVSFLKEPPSQKKYDTQKYTFDGMKGKHGFTAFLKGTKEKVEFKADDSLSIMVKRLKKGDTVLLTYELAPDVNVLKAFEKL